MARTDKQLANLKPIKKGELSNEELKKRQSNGGKKSGEVRREKRDARAAARYILGLAAQGASLEQLERLGASKADGLTNMELLQARLLVMATGAEPNLEAARMLLKTAGYDTEENRKERESINADRRRDAETDAKLTALGSAPDNTTISVNLGDEDGNEDIVFYIPQMLSEEECEVESDNPAENTEEDKKKGKQ